VAIIGAGAGFSFGYDGPTHHGLQDLSSMRLLPEMSILELSSNELAQKAVDFSIDNEGPIYIRLDKGPVPEWKESEISFEKGFRILKPLNQINLISNGFMTRTTLDVAKRLTSNGIDCGVIDLFRVKPPPDKLYEEIICKSKKIITIEESCKTGGLGTCLSELVAQTENSCQLQVIGTPDRQFIEYGHRGWFHKKYGLDEMGIFDAIINNI
jgi:transketolase